MTRFRVSVAMCTYNGEAYVAEQLFSILNQTRPPDEIIICDDGSTDGTVGEVRRILESASEANVQLHRNPINLGYRKNFAQALTATSGDIVFFSDQDDVWMETKIERVMDVFQAQSETLLVYSDAVLFDDDSRRRMLLSERSSDFFRAERRAEEVLQSLHRTHNIKGCLMAFRADLRDAALPIPDGWGHDRWLTILAHALSGVSAVREPLILHRRHESAVTRSFSELVQENQPRPASDVLRRLPRAAKRWSRKAIRGAGRRDIPPDRYRALAARLRRIVENEHFSSSRRDRLDTYGDRAKSLADTLAKRMEVRRLPISTRARKATGLLFRRFYHASFAGVLSYLDDLAMK